MGDYYDHHLSFECIDEKVCSHLHVWLAARMQPEGAKEYLSQVLLGENQDDAPIVLDIEDGEFEITDTNKDGRTVWLSGQYGTIEVHDCQITVYMYAKSFYPLDFAHHVWKTFWGKVSVECRAVTDTGRPDAHWYTNGRHIDLDDLLAAPKESTVGQYMNKVFSGARHMLSGTTNPGENIPELIEKMEDIDWGSKEYDELMRFGEAIEEEFKCTYAHELAGVTGSNGVRGWDYYERY